MKTQLHLNADAISAIQTSTYLLRDVWLKYIFVEIKNIVIK